MAGQEIVFLHIPKTGGRWLRKIIYGHRLGNNLHNIPKQGPYWCVMRDPEIWIQSLWGFWLRRNHPKIQGIASLQQWLETGKLPVTQAHWARLCKVKHRAVLEMPETIEHLSGKTADGYKTFEYDYEFDRMLLRKRLQEDYELYNETVEYWKEWLKNK